MPDWSTADTISVVRTPIASATRALASDTVASQRCAAAQMGPNQEGTPREAIVERMLALLEAAAVDGVELIVYPEMALTTYFPKKIRSDFDQFFETEVPPKALEPLLRRAAETRVAVHVGFCEKTEGKYFNTALLTDRDGRLCG